MAAGSNVDLLHRQSLKYRPRLVALSDPSCAKELQRRLPDLKVVSGEEGIVETAVDADVDFVVAGISGAAGLLPTFRALEAGKTVALANKEALVMAGELIMPMAKRRANGLLPVDSEHSALHQCLKGVSREEIRRLVLTASGGPFLHRDPESFSSVTVREALNHPTWEMGPKITVDSATLMNKGLEVIEAHHLFGVPAEMISIVIHPQSIVHSMAEFVDGTVLAQMAVPDMRSTILYALTFPERLSTSLPRLDLMTLSTLEFQPPDASKFPCISLAYRALESGATYPTALNAANEVAVCHFLKETLAFSSIPDVIEEVLNDHSPAPLRDLETVLEADRAARLHASEVVRRLAARI